MENNLHIAELLKKVQEELILSEKRRLNNETPPLFRVNDLTIEVNFLVEESSHMDGEFNLKVITSGMKIESKSQSVHKITLNLKAIEQEEPMPKESKGKKLLDKFISGLHPLAFPDGDE